MTNDHSQTLNPAQTMENDMTLHDTATTALTAEQARMLAAMARGTAVAQEQAIEMKRELAQALAAQAEILAEMQAAAETAAETAAELARLRDELAAQGLALAAARAEAGALHQALAQERARADHFQAEHQAVLASTSWRLTAPLRRLVLALR